jgi:hypothetical protein
MAEESGRNRNIDVDVPESADQSAGRQVARIITFGKMFPSALATSLGWWLLPRSCGTSTFSRGGVLPHHRQRTFALLERFRRVSSAAGTEERRATTRSVRCLRPRISASHLSHWDRNSVLTTVPGDLLPDMSTTTETTLCEQAAALIDSLPSESNPLSAAQYEAIADMYARVGTAMVDAEHAMDLLKNWKSVAGVPEALEARA